MRITVWNDYICPWAYAARPQTAWLRNTIAERPVDAPSITVAVRSFELHPDIPAEGTPIRRGGRFDQVLDHIAIECERRGQPFVKPSRTPNSRRVLALAELVHEHHVDAFTRFDDAVARAHWVDGRAIDDDAVLAELLNEAGIEALSPESTGSRDGPGLLDRVEGEGVSLLESARQAAMEVGATATPSWQINDLVVTGLHDDAQFHRWVGRILERSG